MFISHRHGYKRWLATGLDDLGIGHQYCSSWSVVNSLWCVYIHRYNIKGEISNLLIVERPLMEDVE